MLIEQGEMAYGWLGVEVDRETLPVVVTDVAEDGPAWMSGIRPGDQIITYNGRPVTGPFHLERLVMETPPGMGVPIRVKRESITLLTEALVVGRQSGSRRPNPYGLNVR
jgi:S1-C subfamily serine protease